MRRIELRPKGNETLFKRVYRQSSSENGEIRKITSLRLGNKETNKHNRRALRVMKIYSTECIGTLLRKMGKSD